jgi:glycosyltransferase involved in cell wall biosynthesis
MERQIMHQVGELGLSEHVRFAGALWDTDRDRMYQAADLFVMPSVSEPFGLVPLEALQHGTPSVITKQSGVGEVLPQALRVDFWDHEAMPARIIEVLRYPVLKEQLVSEGRAILPWLSWRRAAVKVEGLFRRLLQYA